MQSQQGKIMAKVRSAPSPIDDGLRARGWRAIRTNLGLDLPPARQWWNLQAKIDLGTRIGDEERMIYIGHQNDPEDALRHAEWSRRMAEDIGPIFSGVAGLGHEIQNTLGWGAPRQPLNEAIMDMHNNAEGIRSSREKRPINPRQLQTRPRPMPWSSPAPKAHVR